MISLLGMAVLLAIAVLFSHKRRAINIRTVTSALILQIGLGALVLYLPAGQRTFAALSSSFSHLIDYSHYGIDFLFGGLVSDEMFSLFNHKGFIFALRVLPLIVFFSALVSVLYYLGIMQFFIATIGSALGKLLGTSKSETFAATANIFVGSSEAPLVIRPYLSSMTRSELFAVMCGGLASVAGAVLGGYMQLGIEPRYLIAACFMSAPGSLLFAKLLEPEIVTGCNKIERNKKDDSSSNISSVVHINLDKKHTNLIDAAAFGASSGLKLAFNVGAMLLAIISLLALFNGLLGYCGAFFNYPQLSLELLLGWFFSPIAYLIGVPLHEAVLAGGFIGKKIVLNEFVAFSNFSTYLSSHNSVNGVVLSPISQVITTFALCGFANFSSIAVLLGGLGGLVPERRAEIASLGLRAMFAATLSNLMSAAIAGFFYALN